ncbi:hypothetical protein EBS43_08955 [bacterium]|nr:hypothetical protein [bacterium]
MALSQSQLAQYQSLSIEAEPYADVREAGLARIAAKEEWPTYFEDIRPGQRVGRMPRMGHPQDLTVLVRELKVAGFEVRVTYAYNFLLKQGISLKIQKYMSFLSWVL